MRSIGNTIADSLQLSLNYADRLREGVTSENFARLAMPGGGAIQSNHAAFIYGHLALYAPIILEQQGRDDLSVKIPDGFERVFSKDAQCVDDPDGSIYPVMEEVLKAFDSGYRQVITAIRESSDETMQMPNPIPGRMSELFPTIGSLHGFYVGGHMMIHMGQLSAWRRMLGLGPA